MASGGNGLFGFACLVTLVVWFVLTEQGGDGGFLYSPYQVKHLQPITERIRAAEQKRAENK